MTRDDEVPLARLLGMAFRQLVDDLHDQLVQRGWTDVRESYGFVLLAIRDSETSTTELAGLLGVSKQATSKLLEAMEEGGYVSRRDAEADRRIKLVSLAPRGTELLREVEQIYRDLEAAWVAEIGAGAVTKLKRRLEQVLRSRHDGELPRLRPA